MTAKEIGSKAAIKSTLIGLLMAYITITFYSIYLG